MRIRDSIIETGYALLAMIETDLWTDVTESLVNKTMSSSLNLIIETRARKYRTTGPVLRCPKQDMDEVTTAGYNSSVTSSGT